MDEQQVNENKDLTDRLIDYVAERSTTLLRALEQMKENGEIQLGDLKYDLERYERYMVHWSF